MPTPFRHHHEPPTAVRPLYRPLLAEWVSLQHLPSTKILLRRWGRTHPILAGYTTPGELVDAIDDADQDVAEQHLIALVRVFQAGNQLAGRIVLQAMLPALHKIIAKRSPDEAAAAFAEFWIVLSTITITAATTRIASSLKLNTLRGLTRHRLDSEPGDRVELHPDPAELEWRRQRTVQNEQDSSPEIAEVIAWARRTNAITVAEADILTLAYTGPHPYYTQHLATHLGIAPEAAKKRCTRAREKLVHAARALLAAEADTDAQRVA